MRGLRYGLGKSWPRTPAPPDPEMVRRRTRSFGPPLTPNGMGR